MRRVLTVGVTYTGDVMDGVEIDNLGLCRPEVDRERTAYPLYEYDTIIINPEGIVRLNRLERGRKVS